MKLFPDPEETIEGVGRALCSGERTCVDVLESCLAKIDEWEPQVHAWVVIDRDGAIEQARRLDEELKVGKCRGSLHGIPIGIKDIIDVAGLPTVAGFPPWSGRVASRDASVVDRFRRAGAVILGKTVTTQFAWIDPPVTRNPWNRDRTPGGSSSGSAAAVACGMCLGAIGTQTGGSIIRPASFCGVAGFKPSHGRINEGGIVPFAPNLDHPGLIARTARDLRHMFWELDNREPRDERDLFVDYTYSFAEFVEQLQGEFPPLAPPPRIGRLRGFYDRRADPVMRVAFDRTLATLAEAGTSVIDRDEGPFDFEETLRKHRVIMAVEAATVHEERFREYRTDYLPQISRLIEEGLSVPVTRYARCRLDHVEADPYTRCRFDQVEADSIRIDKFFNVIATPATIGPAPGLETTGDPVFNSPWSYFQLPAVSFPIGLTLEGLPLALQLVARFGGDQDVLMIADWCENVIRRAFHSEE